MVAAAFASPAAATDEPDPVAKLRSTDASARLDGLTWLAGQPVSYLAPRRSSLHATLLKLLAKDGSPAVRGAAARALARMEGDDALPALLAAIGNERDAEAERRLPQAFE